MRLRSNEIVLFSGDSITDGNRGRKMDINHIMGHGYQYIVSANLALESAERLPKFINKAYSGAMMGELLEKWKTDVLDNRPTVLSILAGVNDGYFGVLNGLSAQQIADRYRVSLSAALDSTFTALGKIPTLILEPFYFCLDRSDPSYRLTPHVVCEAPFPRLDDGESALTREKRLENLPLLQQAARETAAQFGCAFVQLQDRFAEAMQSSAPEYLIWDGTHPTIAGHALIAQAWMEAFRMI